MPKLPDTLLTGKRCDFPIAHLLQSQAIAPTLPGERRLHCYVVPAWQRAVVWSDKQQARFIEGIFLGLGTGYYVVHGADFNPDGSSMPMSGYLIDGKQRLTAIARFVRGEVPIFNGVHYADIDGPTQRKRFQLVGFPCIELDYQNDENRLKLLYERLCFGGTAHTREDLKRLGPAYSIVDSRDLS